jgi:hypothetical protein
VTLYGHCVKLCEDFDHKFGDEKLAVASQQRTVSHFLFRKGIFYRKQHGCRPHPPYFSLFFRFKIKLKDRHFDTTMVIEAESQAVLNALTEHDFQDEIKNGRSAGNCKYARKGPLRGLWWAVGPKLVFDQLEAPVPEIMDAYLYVHKYIEARI